MLHDLIGIESNRVVRSGARGALCTKRRLHEAVLGVRGTDSVNKETASWCAVLDVESNWVDLNAPALILRADPWL